MNDQWKILFEYARQQLRAAHIPDDVWVLGGGTVLMFHFQHRYSKDIDIFFTDPQYLPFLSPRVNDGVEDKLDDFVEQSNFTRLYFPEGEVDFVLAQPVTAYPQRILQQLPGILTEHPVEIISKKIIHRTNTFKPRDVYDLSIVIDRCGKEMQESYMFFSSVIGRLQARIQFLYDSGRLETELNDMDLIHREHHAAKHSFATCLDFLKAVREDVLQQKNEYDPEQDMGR
jgi:hypothetical protein